MAGTKKIKWEPLGDGSLPTEEQDEGLGHIVPIKIYQSVFLLLIVLTVITILAAKQDHGMLTLFVAMGIATIKAGIVTLFFMHLNWENKIVWGIVIYPLFIFALILGGTLGDVAIKEAPVPMIPTLESQ
jgi:cytochrome c oxidase subunit IV